jgi:hypothetical protein
MAFNDQQINRDSLLEQYTNALVSRHKEPEQQARSPKAQDLHTLICQCCTTFGEDALVKLKNGITTNGYAALLEYSANGFSCLHDIFHLPYVLSINNEKAAEQFKHEDKKQTIAFRLFAAIKKAINTGLQDRQITSENVCAWIMHEATTKPHFTMLNHLFIYGNAKIGNAVVTWLKEMMLQNVLTLADYRKLAWRTKLAFVDMGIRSAGLQELLQLTVSEASIESAPMPAVLCFSYNQNEEWPVPGASPSGGPVEIPPKVTKVASQFSTCL